MEQKKCGHKKCATKAEWEVVIDNVGVFHLCTEHYFQTIAQTSHSQVKPL